MQIQAQTISFKSTASPMRKWLHDHPAAMQTMTCALAVFGIYSLIQHASLSSTFSGAGLLAASYVLHKTSSLLAPPTHDPKQHVFTPATCRGVTLYQKGDLPVLRIPRDVSPYNAGFGRGQLMAAQIAELLDRVRFSACIAGLPKTVNALCKRVFNGLDEEYKSEILGLVAGFNAAQSVKLTTDDVIYFHLLPEIRNLDFKAANTWAQEPMACTVVIDGDIETGPLAARTLDWTPLDVYGKLSLIEERETKQGVRWINHTFPLFLGSVTAMNHHGLAVAMNTARGLTDYPVNTPAVFYLRGLVENCTTFQEAKEYCSRLSPLGSFNLTVFNAQEAMSIHFYQGERGTHYVRKWSMMAPLITLNYRYGEKGVTNPTASNSEERFAEINNAYHRRNPEQPLEHFLKGLLHGSEVNNFRTISTAFIDPKNLKFEISFDNGYAGNRSLLLAPGLQGDSFFIWPGNN